MSKIVIAPYGTLGDVHPLLALAIELRERGHEIVINSVEVYREKIARLGLEFHPMRPEVDPNDRDFIRQTMDPKKGTEKVIKDLMLPNIRPMFEDLMRVCRDADLLISGEIVYAAHSVVEKRNLKFVSTSLAPLTMHSTFEPIVYPNARFLQHLQFLGRPLRKLFFVAMRLVIGSWLKEYKKFRKDIGLNENHDPVVVDKYSKDLHLAMFSKVLAKPQPDWNPQTLQTGFCFYDGKKDLGKMPAELDQFLDAGEPPIVFTLGSSAVMDAGDFFEQSIEAAKILDKRAVFLYGVFNDLPKGLDEKRVGFDYAPYSELFLRASCVVHQGGIGTTAQVLRAGVPHLVVPYTHDQPDNAARCVKSGVARTISRDRYNAKTSAKELEIILKGGSYKTAALELKNIIDSENGIKTACDAIEKMLKK